MDTDLSFENFRIPDPVESNRVYEKVRSSFIVADTNVFGVLYFFL